MTGVSMRSPEPLPAGKWLPGPRTRAVLPPQPSAQHWSGPSINWAVLVEFEREVLVTGAAIREKEVIAGGHKGSLRGVHPDAV